MSEKFAEKREICTDMHILAQAMTTDPVKTFDPPPMIAYAGFHMAQAAADKVYPRAATQSRPRRRLRHDPLWARVTKAKRPKGAASCAWN